MIKIIDNKITGFDGDNLFIDISFSKSGKLFRTINNEMYSCDFTVDSMKNRIITLLIDEGNFLKSATLMKIIGCRSVKSLSKMIMEINKTANNYLRLPINEELIKNLYRQGYRINEKYNMIKTD